MGIIVGLLCVAAGGTSSDVRDVEALFRDVAIRSEETLRAIHTWTGALAFEESEVYSGQKAVEFLSRHDTTATGDFNRIAIGTIHFALDCASDRLFTELKTDHLVFRTMRAHQALAIDTAPFWQRTIVTPLECLSFEPNALFAGQPGDDQASRRTAFRDPPGTMEGQQWGAVVDPRVLFEYTGHALPDYYRRLADMLAQVGEYQLGGAEVRLLRRPGSVQVFLPLQHAHAQTRLFQEFTFVNGRLALLVNRREDGVVVSQWRWAFADFDGVTLPSVVEYKQLNSSGTTIQFQRTLTLTESTLNVDIPNRTFTTAELDLGDGDRLLDRVTGEVRHVQPNGELRLVRPLATAEELDRAVDLIIRE